jgi:pimeloyl-ACP methyl ester carboxylesterase
MTDVPVLLIHGSGGTRAHWEDVSVALGGPSWLHPIDLPGRGGTAPIEHVDAMLAAVLAEMDRRGLSRVIWAGHSMGGVVAQHAALHARDRVAGLVLASTIPLFRVPEATMAAITEDFDAFASAFARPVFARDAAEELRQRATEVLREVGPRTLAADLRTAMSIDTRELAPRMLAPAIVIVGDQDRVTPLAGARELAAGMPHAELRVLEGAGHMLPYERPAEIAKAITDVRAQKLG